MIGQRFGSAGLSEVLVEASAVGPGSVAGVVDGKHYNRAKDCHKVIVEAMRRLHLDAFSKWLSDTGQGYQLQNLTAEILEVRTRGVSVERIQQLYADDEFQGFYKRYLQFSELNRSPTGNFWMSYLEMADLFFAFTRATGERGPAMWVQCGIYTLHV